MENGGLSYMLVEKEGGRMLPKACNQIVVSIGEEERVFLSPCLRLFHCGVVETGTRLKRNSITGKRQS